MTRVLHKHLSIHLIFIFVYNAIGLVRFGLGWLDLEHNRTHNLNMMKIE